MATPYICRSCCRRALALPSRARKQYLTTIARNLEEQTKAQERPLNQDAAIAAPIFNIGLDLEELLKPTANRESKKKDASSDPSLEKLFAGEEGWRPTRTADKYLPTRIEKSRLHVPRNDAASLSGSTQAGNEESQARLLRYSRAPVRSVKRDEDAQYADKRDSRRPHDQQAFEAMDPNEAIIQKHTLKLQELSKTLEDEPATLPKVWKETVATLRSMKKALPDHVIHDKENLGYLGFLLKKTASLEGFKVAGGIVTPADILKVYKECSVPQGWWHEILWIQLRCIIESKTNGASAVSKQKLESAWRTFEMYAKHHGPELVQRRTLLASQGLPEDSDIEQSHANEPTTPIVGHTDNAPESASGPFGLLGRFIEVFGGKYKNRTTVDTRRASAALLLLHYVEQHLLKSRDHFKMDTETLQQLRLLGQGLTFNCTSFIQCLKEARTDEAAVHREMTSWLNSPVETVRQAGFLKPLRPVPSSGSSSFTETHRIQFFKRAARIAQSEDAFGANDLWNRFKPLLKTRNLTEDDKHHVISRFLTLFNELRLIDRSTEVWNLMVEIGLQPDKRHWNAMITGCSKIRDTDSLQSIWENMLRAGIQPDNNLWAAYIYGIIRAGRFDHGLLILEHVGKLWSSRSNPLKPDLAPIRTALSAINDLRGTWGRNAKISKQQLILDWARSRSLTPSTHVYNILLEQLAPTGDPQDIQQHLDAMAADDASPDVITWTLILKGLVAPQSPFFSLYPETQTETIVSILASMTSNGCHPSGPTYSTLLFGLLDSKYRPANIAAARRVLDHMDVAGLQPSEHIHTIILTHYFASSPPDLSSANALLNRLVSPFAKSAKRSATQALQEKGKPLFGSFFWNRVISLYADADEWERALHFFRVRNKGASISWMALVRLLRSLVRAREWGLCEELIRDVMGNRKRGEREGVLGVEDYGKVGQRADDLDEGLGRGEIKIGGKDGGLGGKKVWQREVDGLKDSGFIRPEESSWDQALREGGLVLGKTA